jgi:galactokinase/mevalonate kinase-like predicted kinase
MDAIRCSIQNVLSLPARMADQFEALHALKKPEWFATSDPAGSPLGSGGGTAHALVSAWHAMGDGKTFEAWLRESRKLIVHGGGQSRRLPAYAPMGKSLMPIPVFRWARGQRLNQTLLDAQMPVFQRVLAHAADGTSIMVASGNVLLRIPKELPKFPSVDVLGLGMWVTPETARHFGVFFCPRQRPQELAFFLQKPSPSKIRELASDYLCMVDTGMWLLSERATRLLMKRCKWNAEREAFDGDLPGLYELYSQFAPSVGRNPQVPDAEIGALTAAVIPLPQAEFYHFGASRQMIESMSALQNIELDEIKLGMMGAKRHPDQYVQNSRFEFPLRLEQNHTLWVENSSIPATWQLGSDHVLTGVPPNDWDLRLETGVCLDFVPVGEHDFCLRCYGMDDDFKGDINNAATRWLGRPAPNWFFGRNIGRAAAGVMARMDIQEAPIFPVLSRDQLEPRFIEWLFSAQPARNEAFSVKWIAARRLAARDIPEAVNLRRLYDQRVENRNVCLPAMFKNHRWSVFFKLDLESTARMYAQTGHSMPPALPSLDGGVEPMQRVRDAMFRGAVLRHRQMQGWQAHEEESFAFLRQMIVKDAQVMPVIPRRCVQDDQIVWGRSPVRLDLAGGWTDTPPYCLENGGRVVNVAVDLNGQPPIQVFAKLSDKPQLVMRSIDLGEERHIRTYEELDTFGQPGNEFALAKAAFALAGFLPRFHGGGGFSSLEHQLKDFGGGIEISLLSAVPKGSGLGTSSILAATLLATLGDLCGLNWDRNVLFTRTLALEQMLTTGGGWQDQAGGIFRGFKLIETSPGMAQKPTLRWLPDHLFSNEYANKTILLYYTGITRLAKNILHEIVRGIFLNSPEHLRIVEAIGANAITAFNAAQKADYPGLVESIHNSWNLNQRLDSGTNPPAVQAMLDSIADYIDAAKLLGAGGGGYLLLFAKDIDAARKIRTTLQQNPPNPRARMVNLSLSDTGLQLTRS